MPYKAALADPETFRELRRNNVALCRLRRDLATSIKDREQLARELAAKQDELIFLKHKLAFWPHDALLERDLLAAFESFLAIGEAEWVQYDNVSTALRAYIKRLELYRQVILKSYKERMDLVLRRRKLISEIAAFDLGRSVSQKQ
jgi:hypothetical protein